MKDWKEDLRRGYYGDDEPQCKPRKKRAPGWQREKSKRRLKRVISRP